MSRRSRERTPTLANNIVPAVVLFSGLLGIALIGVPGKDAALHVIGPSTARSPGWPVSSWR